MLLDVDGVLNAVHPRSPFVWDDYVEDHANRFLITYSATVARFFAELAADVEVQWLTTWAELANRFLSPMLGLPDFEVAGSPDWDAPAWWKLTIAQRLWERDHTPFVWLDDDIAFYPEATGLAGHAGRGQGLPGHQQLGRRGAAPGAPGPDHLVHRGPTRAGSGLVEVAARSPRG